MYLWALIFAVAALASPVTESSTASNATLPLPHSLVHKFHQGTWLENIAVRSNGSLLVTDVVTSASLYQISDPTTANPSVSLIHNFNDSVNGILGIAETKPDVFTILGGNFTGFGRQINGTFSAWEVDLTNNKHHHGRNNENYGPPAIRLITAIKPAAFPNGVEAIPRNRTTVLIADSALGLVWRLDTLTGKYSVALQTPEMAVVPGAPLALGINGIRIHNDSLYWTNSFRLAVYRLRIDGNGAQARGSKVEKVVEITEALFLDDFAIDGDGTVWVTDGPGNRVFAVPPSGNYEVVEGAMTEMSVAGCTAAAFGRSKKDGKTLYVTTSGGQAVPVNGTVTEGGKVVAIDTSGYKGGYW
jgi:sugar lactone lactonase YvrE